MLKHYSIAEAKHKLEVIVQELDAEAVIELTRRGEPVAVLLSIDAYRRLQGNRPSFWEAYTAFRTTVDLAVLDESDIFEGVRDSSPGRDCQL